MIQCVSCDTVFGTINEYLEHCADRDGHTCRFCGMRYARHGIHEFLKRLAHLQSCPEAERLLAIALISGERHECAPDTER